jgi:iron(III) transport system permease protein
MSSRARVIAVGVMTAAGTVDRAAGMPFVLIGGIGLLTYAYTVRFLAVAGQPFARCDTPAGPLARRCGTAPGLVALAHLSEGEPAAAASFADRGGRVGGPRRAVKELPLTLILRPFNFDTLSTKAFEFARIEQLREASMPALLIVLCGVLPVLLLDRLAARSRP